MTYLAALILAGPSMLAFVAVLRWLAVHWLATSMTRRIEVDHGQCAQCHPDARWRTFDEQMDSDFGE